ncbi:MAG: EamA family transporter [Alphaproteobacteria bacterium]|nr:EamA family transporter [Alphaproteobacteria bacterium]
MPIRAVLAAILVAICWGGNFTASHFALLEFPPYFMLLLRFTGVALVLAPFVWRYPVPPLRDMALIALFLIVIQFSFVFSAMNMGLSITSVVVATQLGVPFACVLAAILFKDYLGPWRSGGLVVAFLGVLMVAGTPNASDHWGAFLLAVLGSFGWSVANVRLKQLKVTPPVVPLLFWPALLSLPPLALLSALFESGHSTLVQQAHWQGWAGVGYSLFFSSLVGYGVWNRLVATYPMSTVVPYSLLVPVVGIAGGVITTGDPLTLQVLLGTLLTIAGVGVISIRRPQLVEMEQ